MDKLLIIFCLLYLIVGGLLAIRLLYPLHKRRPAARHRHISRRRSQRKG